MHTSIDVFAKARQHERLEQLRAARELDALPYFRVLEGPTLPEARNTLDAILARRKKP